MIICGGTAGAVRAESATSIVQQEEKLSEARALLGENPEQALALSVEIEKKALQDKNTDPVVLMTARWIRADATFRRYQETASSRRLLEQVTKQIATTPSPAVLRGEVLLTRGGLNAADGMIPAALTDYQSAYRVFLQSRDLRSQARVLIRLASLYREGGDFSGAQRYYNQAQEAYSKDPILSSAVYNGLGIVLTDMGRFSEASVAFTKALEHSPKDSVGVRGRILINLARAEMNAGKVEAAAARIAQAIELARPVGDAELTSQVYSVAARVALEQGRIAEARTLIERSFDGAPVTETTLAMRDNHLVAAQIYRRSGDPAKAVEHLFALRRLDEQALEIATSAKTALMGARFDFQNQELRIARLKAEELRRNVAFERSRARFQQILFGSIAAAVAVLVGLLTFGVVTLRRSRNETRAANIDLGITNVALEKALAAKTEFLATTSHEIRTPLNGILGMTQVMLADPGIEPVTRDRIDVVHGAGMRMRELVDDILDVAKMETGNFTIDCTTMDLPATLHEASRLWQEQAQGRGIGFSLECGNVPRWIESDPGRLRQIVFNLLSNALKFTHAGSVGVRVSAAEEGGARRLRIAVWDSGIGIPPDKHAQIFESFRQVDTGTTRQYGGTGLGLTICRNLALALGGDIRVDSVQGEGATFTVDLPLIEAAEPRTEAAGGAAEALLVLDRNPIVRGMMKTLFAPHVADLRFAVTPEEAIAELQRGGVTRLLIDEGALEAGSADIADRVGPLARAAAAAGATTWALWSELDPQRLAVLRAAGIDRPIAKPVSGARLVEALFKTKHRNDGDRPLVSHAA